MIYRFDGRQPVVGQDTYVSELATVIGDVLVGDSCYIGHGAILHGRSIGDLAVIGMGAILSIWSSVGERAIVAEGSVVKANQTVPAGMVVAGNPAQAVREVTEKDMELWAFGKQVYIDLAVQYLTRGMEPVA